MDSTVLLYDLLNQGGDVACVLFHYGQTHYRELDYARRTCRKLNVGWAERDIAGMFSRSSLVGVDGPVVVPNRNAVMLNIACAMAVGGVVTFAANADDAVGFPDCRDGFVRLINATLAACELGVTVSAPYSRKTKREVAAIGKSLGVPFDETWSCYAGAPLPCGQCAACQKRNEALCGL